MPWLFFIYFPSSLGEIALTDGSNFWEEHTGEVAIPDGVSALYLTFKGNGVGQFKCLKFE